MTAADTEVVRLSTGHVIVPVGLFYRAMTALVKEQAVSNEEPEVEDVRIVDMEDVRVEIGAMESEGDDG